MNEPIEYPPIEMDTALLYNDNVLFHIKYNFALNMHMRVPSEWAKTAEQYIAMMTYALFERYRRPMDEEMFKTLKDGADSGNYFDMAMLSMRYHIGDYVERDTAIALEYARKAAEEEEPLGMCLYGEYLLRGEIVSRDIDNGLWYLRQAAAAGDSSAICDLARQYHSGEFVPYNPKFGNILFMYSAIMGNYAAPEFLKQIYTGYIDIDESVDPSIFWMNYLAKAGFEPIKDILSELGLN